MRLYVDRALEDSLSVPAGIDRWLREIERTARELRRELAASSTGTVRLNRIDELRERLDTFLHDEHTSTLHRLLRRPLTQLAPGSAAHRIFTAHTALLFAEARETRDAQEAVQLLLRHREVVRGAHEGRMPFFTSQLIGRAQVEDEDLARVRRPSDVRLMHRRLARAESQLREMTRQLPVAGADERDLALDGVDRVTVVELWSALQLRLRQRDADLRSTGRTGQLRDLQARQIRALRRARTGERARENVSSISQTAAEHLAGEVIRAETRAVAPWEDGNLWPRLLSAAERGRFGSADGADEWQPHIPTGRSRDAPLTADDGTLYVVPFASEFVFISSGIPSPVRVWSRGMREGSEVECEVFGEPDSTIPVERAEGDMAPLFVGVQERTPAWYTTRDRARLVVLCAYGDGWFARVRARGTVRRLGTPPWQHGDDTATAVRVFLSGRTRSADPIPVGRTKTAPEKFLSTATLEVAVPHVGCRVGWLRTMATSSGPDEEGLDRERELFRTLRRIRPHLALVPLGRGQCTGEGSAGYLYVPPLGFQLGESILIREWMREEPAPFIREAAQLFLEVTGAGFALSVYDLGMVAIGLRPDAGGVFQPQATLIAAPGAVRLGHMFPRMSIGRVGPLYPHLGFRGFTPAVEESDTALREADAAGLALLILEMLSPRPISVEGPITKWKDLPAHVEKNASQFSDPELAVEIAGGLPPADDGSSLVRLIESLALSDTDGSGMG